MRPPKESRPCEPSVEDRRQIREERVFQVVREDPKEGGRERLILDAR